MIKQIIRFDSFPLANAFIDATTRDNCMYMRVKVELPAIGVQHHGCSYFSAEMFPVKSEAFQGVDNTIEQEGICEFFLARAKEN